MRDRVESTSEFLERRKKVDNDMSFTKCCNLRYIGENHNPVLNCGYCRNCGHGHDCLYLENCKLKKEIDRLKIQMKENDETLDNELEENKKLRDCVNLYSEADNWRHIPKEIVEPALKCLSEVGA